MLKVIAAENDRMEVSSLELDKQKTCYTYNTVQEIQEQYPTSKINAHPWLRPVQQIIGMEIQQGTR